MPKMAPNCQPMYCLDLPTFPMHLLLHGPQSRCVREEHERLPSLLVTFAVTMPWQFHVLFVARVPNTLICCRSAVVTYKLRDHMLCAGIPASITA